eukprot:5587482-Lingulodinium_polyedra.AAC.1
MTGTTTTTSAAPLGPVLVLPHQDVAADLSWTLRLLSTELQSPSAVLIWACFQTQHFGTLPFDFVDHR